MSSLTFEIEGDVSALITITEVDGTLVFDIVLTSETGSLSDLRALFFDVADETLLSGLSVTGADVTDSAFEANSTTNLGQGANINGQVVKALGKFDAGIAIGTPHDDIQSTQFVLSHDTVDLTLDLLNLQDFGIRIGNAKLGGQATAAPDAVADNFAISEDDSLSANLFANDTDADGDSLTVIAIAGGSVGTPFTVTSADGRQGQITVLPDGTISFDPLGNFNDMAEGETDTVELTYTVSDNNGGTDDATVTITINGANDAATVSSAVIALAEGDAPLSTGGTLTSSDVDNPDDTFTASTTVGTIGTFAIDGSGAWTFTANSAFDSLNVGDSVSETYNVTSVDGTPSTVQITINGTNDAATVSSAVVALDEGDAPLSTGGTLTSSDVDNPDDTFTASTTVGTIGTFAIDGSGAWTFTANSAFDYLNVGDSVSETYNVTSVDGTPSTVQITINGTNDAATVSSAVVALAERDAPLSTGGTLTSSDVDNPDDTFTASTTVGTIGTFAIDGAGAWTFTANSAFDSLNVGDSVSETYNVTSVDGTPSTVQITINGTNDAATVSSAVVALAEGDAPSAPAGR